MSQTVAPGLLDAWGRGLLRSPLLPVAGAFTSGVLLERLVAWPIEVAVALLLGTLVAALVAQFAGRAGLALLYLVGLVVAAGAVWHHAAVRVLATNDLANYLGERPVAVVVRGRLDEEPVALPVGGNELRSRPAEAATRTTLAVEALRQGGDWQAVQGRVRIYLAGQDHELHLGDAIEATGTLAPPPVPSNPGETNRAELFAERGLRGQLYVAAVPGAWHRLAAGWHTSPRGWLAVLRGQGQATLATYLPSGTASLGSMLLLGEASGEWDEWERYIRTGIIAVLAISGQHLVILAGLLEILCRLAGWRQRRYVAVLCGLLFLYALVAGGRPPALRAAVVAVCFAAAILLRRRSQPVNVLALAWLVVGLLDPADLFTPGCQFSFLAVAILIAFPITWPAPPTDPLAQVIEESEPLWWQWLREAGRVVARFYLAALVLWLTLTPLAAWHNHLISPVGILLGPPLTLLATLALALGFAVLLVAPLAPILAPALALPLDGVLRLMQALIAWGDGLPLAWTYVPDLSLLALLLFYGLLLTSLACLRARDRWRLLLVGGPLWLVGVMASPFRTVSPHELRVTFLAVGHGTSVVLELPDGRVVLYDAGSLRGPIVGAQQIAPYLWSRGIGRIDEVFLSHADLDHFNGLAALSERFPIGKVTTTTAFADKPGQAVAFTLARLRARGVEVRTLHAPQVLQAGAVRFDVLHPPAHGPVGVENVRSLVVRVTFAGRSVLLTGDLEGAGLAALLAQPPCPCEVMQYPHHGSRRLDPAPLVRWGQPRWLVACQGATTAHATPAPPRGVRLLSTHVTGAITFRGSATGWKVETFRGGD